MANIAVLQKVLQVREQEKTVAQKEKTIAETTFEQRATELYELLKKKENAEKLMDQYISAHTSIERIKEQSLYIQSMVQNATTLQEKVQVARTNLQEKQQLLTEAHIEMKKIEKMIEYREIEQNEIDAREENMLMDEISIRQFTTYAQNR